MNSKKDGERGHGTSMTGAHFSPGPLVTKLVVFFCCCGQIPGNSDLMEEGFILLNRFKNYNLLWLRSHGERSVKCPVMLCLQSGGRE